MVEILSGIRLIPHKQERRINRERVWAGSALPWKSKEVLQEFWWDFLLPDSDGSRAG
jgi:hypothetical protein